MVVLLAGLLAGIAFLTTIDRLLAPDALTVRQVRFEGEFRRVAEAELGAAVRSIVNRNFLLLDLDAIKQRIEKLPWVYRASVRRAWPRDLHVEFIEQQIVARWGDREWVNHAGEAVTLPAGTELPKDMPRLHGPDGTSAAVLNHYQQLAPIFAAQGLLLERLMLTPRRSWQIAVQDVRTHSRFTLVLDRFDAVQKAERFARSYAQMLASRVAEIRQVDLRYANGFAVQWQKMTQPNGG